MSSAFIESCIDATAGSAAHLDRKTWRRPRVNQLIRHLKDHPDASSSPPTSTPTPMPSPAASASRTCSRTSCPAPMSPPVFKGRSAAGSTASSPSTACPTTSPGTESTSPHSMPSACSIASPPSPTAPSHPRSAPSPVIDHHPAIRGQRCRAPFNDIRRNVGASSSIVFGYFMEKDIDIPKDIAALMLYGIESDLAGAAGQPGDLTMSPSPPSRSSPTRASSTASALSISPAATTSPTTPR